MSTAFFEELKRYAGFSARDEKVLRKLGPQLEPHFPRVVDEFYARILENDTTRKILADVEQVEVLKDSLSRWLRSIFRGPFNANYYRSRVRIGQAHVRVGLAQGYVFVAMSHVRRTLFEAIEEDMGAEPAKRRDAQAALSKILDIDLAIVAGSYHQAEKYQDLVDSAPEMIHRVDLEGNFISVNRTGTLRLGYPASRMLHMNIADLVPRSEREILRRQFREIRRKGESRCELTLKTASGETLSVEMLATGERDEFTGQVVSARIYLRDTSDRKEAEEKLRRERDRAQQYLDIAGVMFVALNARGEVVLVNKKACELLGYPEEEILGKDWCNTFVPESAREDVNRVASRLLEGETSGFGEFENPVVTKHGEERMIAWRNTVIRRETGEVVGTLSSGMDITETTRMQKELLERASLARLGEMAAVVAHEVRNPLAGIRGSMQIIGNRLPRPDDREVIDEIIARIDSLNGIVNDMLLFMRPRQPHRATIPVRSLLQDTVSLLHQDPGFDAIEVEVSGIDLVVPVDAELLKPVFLNLLLNSAQAMEGNGKIRVEIGSAEGYCRVAVADTGPGIPSANLGKIFEPFFTTKHRGSGLGLPTAKRLVEMHGGFITVSAGPSKGTTVTVLLPMAENRTSTGAAL